MFKNSTLGKNVRLCYSKSRFFLLLHFTRGATGIIIKIASCQIISICLSVRAWGQFPSEMHGEALK